MASTTASPPPLPVQKPLSSESILKLPALIPRKKRTTPANPVPAPATPALLPPPDVSALTPTKPSRRILSEDDMVLFQRSSSYPLVLAFVFSLSEASEDQKISSIDLQSQSPFIKRLLALLDTISELADANPRADQGESRFGNPAFRNFVDALNAQLPAFHQTLELPDGWADEVSAYLADAFGSRARIDYGSGHELHFAIWLLCLNRLSLLPPATFSAVALLVFPRYIHVMRKIQWTYYLEPAGSHGVWGLDDYHFLPFLFGASQLLHHPYITPLGIHNELTLEEEGDDFLYLDMVRFTVATKTVKGLKWTQPMLDDISGAKNWAKVEQGMRRMLVKEVLGKLPIMQHFLFGTLVAADARMSREEDIERSEMEQSHGAPGHVHHDDGFGDPCGIKIPSLAAASQEAGKHAHGGGFRRVPFD